MEYRIEKDTMGEIKVASDKWWLSQTQRSLENFKIGTEKMPIEVIEAYLIVKEASAKANLRLKNLDKLKASTIIDVCQTLRADIKATYEHFPLVVWQTGSGTQTNMNVNEVIAHCSNKKLAKTVIHPNDDVNRSQSSNDTFPTVMHIASYLSITNNLLPALRKFRDTLEAKVKEYQNIIKIGRTHLQDATPLTLGQEISGWAYMLEKSDKMIEEASNHLRSLAIGGTAVGTGMNAHKLFGEYVAQEISKLTDTLFYASPNKFHALTSHDEISFVHGAIKALAQDLMKIANDVRWLASGPRSGIGEITLPENEPGSSIMPGKVNPTQAEALTMVVAQVIGNDVTIGFASSQGNFELNVFKPVIIYNFLQSVNLLSDAINSFNLNCVMGIKPNLEVINNHVNQSLMLVTALTPYIGYEKAAIITKTAFNEQTTLKAAAIKLGYLTETEYDKYVNPTKMTEPYDIN